MVVNEIFVLPACCIKPTVSSRVHRYELPDDDVSGQDGIHLIYKMRIDGAVKIKMKKILKGM